MNYANFNTLSRARNPYFIKNATILPQQFTNLQHTPRATIEKQKDLHAPVQVFRSIIQLTISLGT